MFYREFKDLKISALGMGCMRFPVKDNDYSKIDEEETAKLIDYAMKHGVNYYDTAWGYHSGNSETVMGKILAKYPRDSFYLATKFPGYSLDNMDKVKEIFERQLEKCGVEYFDFYLFHNVCEMNINEYLDPKFGIFDYLVEQKKNGRIRHLGFSAHGSIETMTRFIEAYGAEIEFCQIQLNWLDWTFQNAKGKVELLRKHNIPVWVMEPVRGGGLVKLSEENENILKAISPERTIPQWAFLFLHGLKDAVVTLSGMSNLGQLKENIAVYESCTPLAPEEEKALLDLADKMISQNTVPCTGCRYCTDYCPMKLDIPWLLKLYNEHNYTGGGFIAPMALSALSEDKKPSACIGCRSCENVCPQQIKISETLADFSKKIK